MGKPHLLNKFACENTEFEIQLTKQASLNLEKENLPQGGKGGKGFLLQEKGIMCFEAGTRKSRYEHTHAFHE